MPYQCGICLDSSEHWKSLPCGHIFCDQCTDSLCQPHLQECGYCRRRFSRSEIGRVYIPEYSESDLRHELRAVEAKLANVVKKLNAIWATFIADRKRHAAFEASIAVEIARLRGQVQKLALDASSVEGASNSNQTRPETSFHRIIGSSTEILAAIFVFLLSLIMKDNRRVAAAERMHHNLPATINTKVGSAAAPIQGMGNQVIG